MIATLVRRSAERCGGPREVRLARLVLVLALLLAGCSQPMHHFRFPPGRTQQDFERDTRLCNLDAQTLQRNTWFGGRTSGQTDTRFVDCMKNLGYVEFQPSSG